MPRCRLAPGTSGWTPARRGRHVDRWAPPGGAPRRSPRDDPAGSQLAEACRGWPPIPDRTQIFSRQARAIGAAMTVPGEGELARNLRKNDVYTPWHLSPPPDAVPYFAHPAHPGDAMVAYHSGGGVQDPGSDNEPADEIAERHSGAAIDGVHANPTPRAGRMGPTLSGQPVEREFMRDTGRRPLRGWRSGQSTGGPVAPPGDAPHRDTPALAG